MNEICYVGPAYGVRYNNIREVKKAWLSGNDFRICGGPYVSIRDSEFLRDQGVEYVMVMYGDQEGKIRHIEIEL